MKANVNRFVVLLGGALAFSILNARANFEVSAGVSTNAETDFCAPLATEGPWVQVGSYGRCWRPAGVAVGRRPYWSGQWIWTDCGWYWQSDEPWAWANPSIAGLESAANGTARANTGARAGNGASTATRQGVHSRAGPPARDRASRNGKALKQNDAQASPVRAA